MLAGNEIKQSSLRFKMPKQVKIEIEIQIHTHICIRVNGFSCKGSRPE